MMNHNDFPQMTEEFDQRVRQTLESLPAQSQPARRFPFRRALSAIGVAAGGKQCAKDISEQAGVTLRFALKILRKLTQSGITKSYKGVAGGYELNRAPSEISLGEIIECIDGPIAINQCLSNEFQCTRVGNRRECDFHRVFGEINRSLRDQLCSITMDRFLPSEK